MGVGAPVPPGAAVIIAGTILPAVGRKLGIEVIDAGEVE